MFVITGGGSGVGRALARELAAEGREVLVVGRRTHPLEETAQSYPTIHTLSADVATDAGRQAIVSYLQPLPALSGLIHNAGTIEPITPMKSLSPDDWHHTLATNVDPALFLTQALLPQLASGRVLHIGSAAAYFPVKGWAAYCVSKAALAMLTQCWQLESPDVAFTSTMPGIIDTDMQALIRQASAMDPEKLDFFRQLKGQDRLISAESAAAFLAWLLVGISKEEYVSREWDIYDTSHHAHWVRPPFSVPALDE